MVNITYEFPNVDCKNAKKKYRNFLTIFAKIELELQSENEQENFMVRYFPSEDTFLIQHQYYHDKVNECQRLKKNTKFTFETENYLTVEDFNPITCDDYYHAIKGKGFSMEGVGVTTRNQERQGEGEDNIEYFSPWEIAINWNSE